ncbi:SWIM zinc finger family protein [Paenibacillus humicola]|uniref:SWIM zinc finger family protein n=1 Tax=Paenibacillus humicola TaxID=3110540 RepID=UPI00237A8617|nr:SWIM zinc finger family protein [Paenibacillus humicola]
MSAYFLLDEQRLRSMETKLAEVMPISMLERGWDYYRREKVLSVQVMDGASIYGAVRGADIYAVTLDGDDFGFSACTCPFNGFCKHMAAVYFAYCAYAGESPDEVYNRLLYGGGLIPAEDGGTPAAGRLPVPETPIPPADWAEEMEGLYGETWRQCRHSLHPLQSVLTSLKGSSKTWDPELRRMHWMLATLFVAEQAERAYSMTDTYSRYYYEMAFARMTEPWLDAFHEMAAELRPSELSETAREAVRSLNQFFHDRDMDREHQLHRWEALYFSLWAKLTVDPAWSGPEKERLERRLNEAKAAGRQSFFYPMALAFVAFIEGRDEKAIVLLRETDFNKTALLACDCALQRLEEGGWTALADWMGYLYEGLRIERKSRAFGPFLNMCRFADERQPENPVWQRYLVSFLPYSYSVLTDHWVQKGQFGEWADLQLLLGIEPDEIDAQLSREVTKQAPHALLPLYHQAIDTAIRARNRQGYRHAVKLMKKLEKLYKALKQTGRWTRYVDGIVRKHQRLRALQEELWRGKIIR